MESTLIWSYAICLTLDTPIDFAFSPRLILILLYEKTSSLTYNNLFRHFDKGIVLCQNVQHNSSK